MTEQAPTTTDVHIAGVVLAAGHGARFGGPKHEVSLGGCRMVDRALDLVAPFCRDLVVVVAPGAVWEGRPLTGVVEGGASRTDSLRAAMAALRPDVEVVVSHDCVRPLAQLSMVEAVIAAVLDGADAAIACWQPPDPVKRVRPDGGLEHLGREELLIAQSPSAYRRATLDAMFAALDEIPVDETVGVERIGGRVVPVLGDRWSQHLVDQRDLALFERLLSPVDGAGEKQ